MGPMAKIPASDGSVARRVGTQPEINKGIGDAGSTADLRMVWSAIVCLGLL